MYGDDNLVFCPQFCPRATCSKDEFNRYIKMQPTPRELTVPWKFYDQVEEVWTCINGGVYI